MNYGKIDNFFEINMIKDYNSKNFKKITENEVNFLTSNISRNSSILEIMCGYGRLANKLSKLGYKNLDGVDIGSFDFILEPKEFNFYQNNYYEWVTDKKYDYCYSIYNSYVNYNEFLSVIEKAKKLLNKNGVLIIDIFNNEWRNRQSKKYYKLVNEDENIKVELFRDYNGINEISKYKVLNKKNNVEKTYKFSQYFASKKQLLELDSDIWEVIYIDSKTAKTRDDDQKHILIMRKKGD